MHESRSLRVFREPRARMSNGRFAHVLIWTALLSLAGVLYVRDGQHFLAAQSLAMKMRAQESAGASAAAKAAAEVTPAQHTPTPVPAGSGETAFDHEDDDGDDGDDEFDGTTAGAINDAAQGHSNSPKNPETSTGKDQTSSPTHERVQVTVRFCTS